MNQLFAPESLQGAAPARFTADEFLRMAELGAFQDMKVELSHGELIRMILPHDPHGAMQAQLIGKLYVATGGDPGVRGEVAVRLSDDTVRGFDAGLIHPVAGAKALAPENVRLAVEVSGTTLKEDPGPKARDYADAGLPACWVIDVNARIVHAMTEPAAGAYARRDIVRFGEPLPIPGRDATIILD